MKNQALQEAKTQFDKLETLMRELSEVTATYERESKPLREQIISQRVLVSGALRIALAQS